MGLAVQHVVNTLSTASGYALIGMSFWVVFRIGRFLDVCHALSYVTAPYVAYTMARSGAPVWLATLTGVSASVLVGLGSEQILFRHLRDKGASSLVLLLASFGAYVIGENALSIAYGDDPIPFPGTGGGCTMVILGAHFTSAQVWRLFACGAIAAGLGFLFSRTTWGTKYRAVSDNPQLATITGISHAMVIGQAYALAGAVAGIAGILAARDTFMDSAMGLQALLMGVVVVVVAGDHGIPGVLLSAAGVALFQFLGVTVTSSGWHNTTAFILLFLFMVCQALLKDGTGLFRSLSASN